MSPRVKWAERLSGPLWRIQESFAELLTNREMAPLRLPTGCHFPLESALHIPVLGFRCLGKRVDLRRLEDKVWKKEAREVRGNAGGGEREEERRRGMGRGRKPGGSGGGTEMRELRAKRKARMGIWEGEAGRGEGDGGSWKERI